MSLETARSQRIGAVGFDYDKQPKQHLLECNLCGGATFIGLTREDRYGYSARAVACSECGLVFLNPVMTAAAYKAFYAGVYRPLVSAHHGRLIDEHTVQEEQRTYASELVDILSPHLSRPPCKLLDVGGSTGVIAHHLSGVLGCTAVLVDPAPLEVEQATQMGIEAVAGVIEDFTGSPGEFDLITMCQTVDHLLDVRSALEKVRGLLNGNGLFFIDTVDLRAAYLRNWDVTSAIKVDHPYYLTEPTMEAYLAVTGFRIEAKEYSPDGLHIGYVCRPGQPDTQALPSPGSVTVLLQEIRYVTNVLKEGR